MSLAAKFQVSPQFTTYFSQGSAATDLRGGGSFNSIFLRRSFLNLTVKKNYENWSTSNKVLPFGAKESSNYDSPRISIMSPNTANNFLRMSLKLLSPDARFYGQNAPNSISAGVPS